MTTQLIEAREGRTSEQMRQVAADEGVPVDRLREAVARGRVVIPFNTSRQFDAVGIGEGLSTKVNANIGTSGSHCEPEEELRKLEACVRAGAHAVMDLSTGTGLNRMREKVLAASPIMVGTVPIYAVAAELDRRGEAIEAMTADGLFTEIETQCRQGVDFITVHCGVTRAALACLEERPRLLGVVSRGGSMLSRWMMKNERENLLLTDFDRLLDLCVAYDVTLSLGDGLRPGAIADASDPAQIEELTTLGRLALRARRRGVQAMIEGPGHVPLDQVAGQIQLQKQLCDGAPFYVLGPLVTDIGAGHDHVSAAIGGAVAAMSGADFLCYVTSAEHLRLPTVAEVREGVIATRLAAHAGDIVKLGERASRRDRAVSDARRRLDWEGMYDQLLDPVAARHKRSDSEDAERDVCSMCGDLCAVKTFDGICPHPEE
jgi:phosphomethylpyrimidine synthase